MLEYDWLLTHLIYGLLNKPIIIIIGQFGPETAYNYFKLFEAQTVQLQTFVIGQAESDS